jgi:hypothetical protein
VGDQKDALEAQARGIMSSKYFKLLTCAALICLVAFVFFIDFGDDPSAYGPNAGAPVVHGSAPGQ